MNLEGFLERNRKKQSLKRNKNAVPTHFNQAPLIFTDTEIGRKPWECFLLNRPF